MADSEDQTSFEEERYVHFHTRASISPTDLQALPTFENDSRDLPIFIEYCEEFLEVYSDKKNPNNPLNSYLVKLIKSKLRGDAKYLIWVRECKTWDEIKSILEINFGDKRTEENLFSDLINFKSDGSRNYHGMGVEIRTLLGLLIAKCKLSVKDPHELSIKENLYGRVALNTYLKNLYFYNKDIANPVRFQNPKSLEEAMQFVSEEMNWQYSCSRLQYSAAQTQPSNFPFGVPPPLQPQKQTIYGYAPEVNKQTQLYGQQNFFPQTQQSLQNTKPSSVAGTTLFGGPFSTVKGTTFGSSNIAFGSSGTTSAPTGFAFGSTQASSDSGGLFGATSNITTEKKEDKDLSNAVNVGKIPL